MERTIKEERKQAIINEYVNDGASIQQLSKKYHHKPVTISKILKSNNIMIKQGLRSTHLSQEQVNIIQEMAAKRYYLTTIAETIGISTRILTKYCKENEIFISGRKINHNINENYFSIIDTEEKAYLLGLFFTDGYIKKYSDNQMALIGISLQKRDRQMIERIKNILNLDNVIQYDNRPGKESVIVEFYSDIIANDLAKFKIIPRKTYETIGLPDVPEHLLRHFLRGLFDGDGIFSFKEDYNEASVGFCSYHYKTVEDFQKIIDRIIHKEQSNKIRKQNCWQCSWRGRRQVLNILAFLYDGTTIFLERKYEKYQKLLSTVAVKDMV